MPLVFGHPLDDIPGETIVIELVFEVRKSHDPTKRHKITVPTSVTGLFPLEVEIEGDPTWIPGGLHIHSIYSDGDFNLFHLRDVYPNLRGRGYRFVYMTDHVGTAGNNLHRSVCLCPTGAGMLPPCNATSTWGCYVTNTQRVTSPEIAFFPGAEYRTRPHWLSWPAAGGHALIYGLNSLVRSDGVVLHNYDLTGPDLVLRSPLGSTLSIAHPQNDVPSCRWRWDIYGYRGAELMAPGPFNELLWWRDRAFSTRALSDAVAGLGVLSVRTGSDYHGEAKRHIIPWYQVYTYVRIPTTFAEWQNAPWSVRRQHVNTALREGRTVASRHGGFARLTVNGRLPGAVLHNIPANSTLNFNVVLRPVRTNPYRIRIFKNRDTVVVDHWVDGTAGVTISLNFTGIFPGGTHGYWLMVEEGNWGTDFMLSTHVVVTSQS